MCGGRVLLSHVGDQVERSSFVTITIQKIICTRVCHKGRNTLLHKYIIPTFQRDQMVSLFFIGTT